MDYEKKYKEAVNKIRDLLNDGEKNGFTIVTYKTDLESIFPELAESKDEMIRKALLELVHDTTGDELWVDYNVHKENALAWLEKQGEKSVNEVKPKFKVGDWILYSGDHYEGVRHITKINENGYYIERNGLPHGIIPFNHEVCMRLWTIQDAKDGDVLINDFHLIFIFKEIKNNMYISHCSIIDRGNDVIVNSMAEREVGDVNLVKCQPATKEQRDLLFQKMREAGYEWDAEKKELKIIDWSKQIKYNPNSPSIIEKSAWSEEEEVKINRIVACLENLNVADNDILLKDVDWLKSLRPQNRWKPSDEQMEFVWKYAEQNNYDGKVFTRLYNDLKKLKGG